MNLKNKNEYLSYKSPEILKNCKASKEDDIYSFDCIIYFVLSKGKHPFNFDTSKDVLENKKDLSALENSKNKDENQIYLDLITNMIKLKRTERPTIQNVLNHPMFWKPKKVLKFYTDIKNLFHAKNEKVMETPNFKKIQSKVILDMENKRSLVFGKNWLNTFCPVLKKYEQQKITNNHKHSIRRPDSYISLLDYIRNKDQHYDEWPECIKKIFGSTVESYLDYFKQRFPLLLITTYDLLKEMKAERKLDSYY